ncbi:MAG TPA: VWA domain-containing protein [Candidatus Acidoferrales bacterium]|nr:VWA domain-containing protein [Candidatus Acidoferrales bacterium]
MACAILLLAASFQASFASPPAGATSGRDAPSNAVLSEETRLVVVPVSVTDRQGHFVSGLKESNFRVYEDGKAQEIAVFRDADVPVTVGIVVDHSGSMEVKSDEVIQGATAFVEASNPQDKEFVVNFGKTVSFGLSANVPFTSNIAELRAALSTPSASGMTALYDAVAMALQHFQGSEVDKKVLLLISDGGDNASAHKLSQVLRMAQAANVVIYAIGLLDPFSADQNPDVLRKFARGTGGEVYFPNSTIEVVSVCVAIATDIRHQYTLAYAPPENGGKRRYRRIHVVVHAPGRGRLFVRTRKGYFLSAGSSTVADDTSARGRQ